MKTLVCTVILRISISVAIVGKSLCETDFSGDRNPYSFVCFVSIGKAGCTGSILTASAVLTASQCVLLQDDKNNNKDSYVIAGKLKFSLSSVGSDKQIQKRKIKELVPYSAYFDIFKDDIMLLKLEKDFEINSYVSTIQVMNRATYPKVQQELCEMLTLRQGKSEEVSLEVVRVVAEHPDRCLLWTEEYRLSTLCSRFWKPMGVCEGDSGAPLICQAVLTGLFKSAFVEDVSSASCQSQVGFDDFVSFTYVGYYVPWIHIHADGVQEGIFTLYETAQEKSRAATLLALHALPTILVLPMLSNKHN